MRNGMPNLSDVREILGHGASPHDRCLWEIRWSKDSKDFLFFVGTREDMAAEIARLHRVTGLLHVARMS